MHEENLCHFDLKPQNVLISRESGQIVAKVHDFGIAQEIITESE